MYLKYYLESLNYQNMPSFLEKYLEVKCLQRLKKVGYFCGMDYASKDIYSFKEKITRFDHSLTVALLVYKLTNDLTLTIAALFHDIATPCFSHVIDYMNQDYELQESTEEYTEFVLKKDDYLKKCLKMDSINIEDIINFKKFSIVDNERPKLCADRIDGIILNGISWTKNIELEDIKNIIEDLIIFINEFDEQEIGFKTRKIVEKIISVNASVNILCQSKEDNYMMNLLAKITKIAIEKKYITYESLYFYNEEYLFELLKKINDQELSYLIYLFENVKKDEIFYKINEKIKKRIINPLLNGKRFVK
ncbi:MAG: HD domain-containing protein [Firmicutes bacterium]|nr:HD domain-containing protein [Bacillota bacterium]